MIIVKSKGLLPKSASQKCPALSLNGVMRSEFYALYYGFKKVQRGSLDERAAQKLQKYYKRCGIEVSLSAYKAQFQSGLADKRPLSDQKAQLFFY
ncbi:MAG: hypothetical protein WDL87_08790, partial [Candidatus Omnitrophota bacterium]